MKKLLIITLLLSLFSGCDFFYRDNCNTYCDGTVRHECENSGGMFGGTDSWGEYDCNKEGKICTSVYGYPGCYYDASECEEEVQSFCKDKTIFKCSITRDKIYANPAEDCLVGEVCVEFPDYAKCAIPVEECDLESFKVCANNMTAKCYENDGEFYVVYDEDCGEEECVEMGDGNVNCLIPVEECVPSQNDFCINNQIGRCYEINDSFYVYYKQDCGRIDHVCVELDNNEVDCFAQVDVCDLEAESICRFNAVSECLNIDGNYYVDVISYCYSDKCKYDTETNSAHCLSD